MPRIISLQIKLLGADCIPHAVLGAEGKYHGKMKEAGCLDLPGGHWRKFPLQYSHPSFSLPLPLLHPLNSELWALEVLCWIIGSEKFTQIMSPLTFSVWDQHQEPPFS